MGTKGYTFDGPLYQYRRRQITGWDGKEAEHAEKSVEREPEHLPTSFETARNDGYTRFISFLHCLPTNILERRSGFTDIAEEDGAEQVIYAHCHGQSRFHDSKTGYFRLLFIHAMEAIVGIPIGHTSMQDRDFEQFLPKCAPYIPAMSFDFDWFLAATR